MAAIAASDSSQSLGKLANNMQNLESQLAAETGKDTPDMAKVYDLESKLRKGYQTLNLLQNVKEMMNRMMEQIITRIGQIGK